MSDRVKEIEERLAKATPGPWAWTRMSNSLQVYGSKAGDVTSGEWICECATEDDQALIAHAPDDIAYLLTELKAARALLKEAEGALESAHRELSEVLHNSHKGKVHFDGDDFHEVLRVVIAMLARLRGTQ